MSDNEEIKVFMVAFNLTQTQAAILRMLLNEAVVEYEAFEEAFELPPNLLRTTIHRIRAKLSRHNIKINTTHCLGYSMSPTDKEYVREEISRFSAAV